MKLSKPMYRDKNLWQYKKMQAGVKSFNIITQLFGENLVDFYKKLGLKGHNGIDLSCKDGEPVYATHDGIVSKIYDRDNSSKTKGFGVYILDETGFTTVYWHLTIDVEVKLGWRVEDGDLIGYADNSGEYTTGTHLHFGLYPKNRDNKNGYYGAIDPLPFILNKKTMVDEKKLKQIYNEILCRDYDEDAKNYLGHDEDFVRSEVSKSEERKMIVKIINLSREL